MEYVLPLPTRASSDAKNSVAIAALIPLQIVLDTIVDLNRTQCVSVAADGYEDFMKFENMQWDSIEKWILTAIQSNINRVGLSISSAKERGFRP